MMANTKSIEKRIRQNEKKRRKNKSVRSKIKTHREAILSAVSDGQLEDAEDMIPKLYKLCDRASKKGIIHENKAGRIKSRTMSKIQDAREA